MAAAASDNSTIVRCGAKTRGGTACKQPSGAGTDHQGFGHCKFHGGLSPNGMKYAAKLQAAQLGAELDCDPHEAILKAVRKAAMWERFCAQKVAGLTDDQLVVPHARTVEHTDDRAGVTTVTESRAELNLWLREHQHAVRDLAHLGKVAVDAGVAERQVRLAEQLAEDWGRALRAILDELELSAEQRAKAPIVVERHLRLLEGGVAA